MQPNPPTVPARVKRPRRPLHWRQEYLHITLALMTACWLAGWATLTLNWFLEISLANTLGITVFHMLASALLVRWMTQRQIAPGQQTVTLLLLMWIAAVVTILAATQLATAYGSDDHLSLRDMFYIDQHARIPGGPLLIVWVLFFWWRGSALGSAYLTVVRTTFGLRLGILALLWLVLVSGRSLRADVLATVPLFFFLGLISSSLARADSLDMDRAGHNTTFGRGWMVSLLFISILITVGGYVSALWLAGIEVSRASNVLGSIGEGALTLLFVIFSPLLYLGQIAYNTFAPMFAEEPNGTTIDNSSSSGSDSINVTVPWLADIITFLSNVIIVAVVVFIVVLLLAFVWFVIFARSQRTPDGDEHEMLGTGEVIGGLRQAWRDGWRRFTDALGILREFGLGRQFFAALTIRRIYASMEKLAAGRGYPRSLAQTPYEYQATLAQAFPDLNQAIAHITEAYIAVRYGEVPEDPAEVQAVRAAWQQLKTSPDPTA